MRWLLALLLLPLLAMPALAHGGSGFRGPNGGVPPGLREPPPPPPPPFEGIPCDWGLVEWSRCSSEVLRAADDVRVAAQEVTESKRWGDVALCRVEISLETSREGGAVEGHARLDPGPLFAAIGGSVRCGEETLAAERKPREAACRTYMHAHFLHSFEGTLVLRRGPGRIDVRTFWVRKGAKVTVVIEGYLLVDAIASERVQLYRTGDRYLAVVPVEKDKHGDAAAFRDERTGRALHFLTAAECRQRFLTDAAREVPFVAALEAAATGRGDSAASDTSALLAIPAEALATGSWLRVPRSRSPVDPLDPEPPPPGPTVRDATDREGQ